MPESRSEVAQYLATLRDKGLRTRRASSGEKRMSVPSNLFERNAKEIDPADLRNLNRVLATFPQENFHLLSDSSLPAEMCEGAEICTCGEQTEDAMLCFSGIHDGCFCPKINVLGLKITDR